MAERFARHLLLGGGHLRGNGCFGLQQHGVVLPVTEYVSYVVTTDLSLQPILERMILAEKLPQWQSWLKGWTEVTSGW